MQLRPREIFTIARGLEDHTDSSTYYVRAVIRNARTYATIETVTLEDQGDGHIFLYDWQVPADSSGEGFYILITISVYTDAGFTIKSDLYGDKYTEYLIADRINPNSGMGGGADIDYKKIRQIVREEMEKIEKPEKVDLAPIFTAIENISFPKIKLPETKEVDLTPIMEALDGLKKCMPTHEEMEKMVPEVDMGPIHEHLNKNTAELEEMKEKMEMEVGKVKDFYEKMDCDSTEISQKMNDMFEKVRFLCLDDMTEVRKNIGSINKFILEIKELVSEIEDKLGNNNT